LYCHAQLTRDGSAFSHTKKVPSGVVQGSILGPLLSMLFVNDVSRILNDNQCACKLYADDLKINTSVSLNDSASVLQYKSNDLYLWFSTWQLNISGQEMDLYVHRWNTIKNTNRDDTLAGMMAARPIVDCQSCAVI
jgi:Reverse transcriptase (RNA-dependent DNA polymerase)